MRLAASIAWRYLATQRRQFSRFITWVSVVGLALGVLVLTVVNSVMNGFDAELRQRLLGALPHVTLAGMRANDLGDLAELDQVVAVFDYFQGTAMITRNGAVNPVTLYGVDEAGAASLHEIRNSMTYGSVDALLTRPRAVVLGAPLAMFLGLFPGDSVALVIPSPRGESIAPVIKTYTLVGTFDLGATVDFSLALVGLDEGSRAELAAMGELGAQLRLDDPMAAPAIAAHLRGRMPDTEVTDWTEVQGELFQAVRLEKAMMFLMLLLVVAIAAFNIVSGQLMVVSSKRADVAILRTMGATGGLISWVFLLQGVVIGGIGIVAGLALGLLAVRWINEIVGVLESVFDFRFLEGSWFVEIPHRVVATDLWSIAALAVLICVLSAWIPARRARGMNPVEGLHGV